MGDVALPCPPLRVCSLTHRTCLLHAQQTRKPVSLPARHAYAYAQGTTSQLPRFTPLLCRFSSQSTCWNDALGTAHDSALHPVHVPPEPCLHIHNSAQLWPLPPGFTVPLPFCTLQFGWPCLL